MKEFRIPEMNKFMGKLLKGDAFDALLLREGLIRTFMDFRYDGSSHNEYFDTEDTEKISGRYVNWGLVRNNAFSVVKGNRTPLLIQLSFTADKPMENEVISCYQVKVLDTEQIALNLSFTFSGNEGKIITGVYRSNFSLDKELEKSWDDYVFQFFKKNDLFLEEIS